MEFKTMTKSHSVHRVLMAVATVGTFMGATGMAYAQGGGGMHVASAPPAPQMLAMQHPDPTLRTGVNCPVAPSQAPVRGTSGGGAVFDGTPPGSG